MESNPQENRLLDTIERSRKIKKEAELVARAHEKARRILRRDAIRMRDFAGIEGYTEEEIKRDMQYVLKLAEQFTLEEARSSERREPKIHADILEAIIHEQIGKSGWMGSEATAIKTSPYDDLAGGIDEVVEFGKKEEGGEGEGDGEEGGDISRLALNVDVTFSGQLKGKFKRIKDEIAADELAGVKYFASGDYKGRLVNQPRVIVGVEMQNVKKLRDMWLAEEGEGEALRHHPFQMLMLEEILKQCRVFAEYARAKNHEGLAKAYQHSGDIVSTILQQKSKESGLAPGRWEDDSVFAEIKRQLQTMREEVRRLKN